MTASPSASVASRVVVKDASSSTSKVLEFTNTGAAPTSTTSLTEREIDSRVSLTPSDATISNSYMPSPSASSGFSKSKPVANPIAPLATLTPGKFEVNMKNAASGPPISKVTN